MKAAIKQKSARSVPGGSAQKDYLHTAARRIKPDPAKHQGILNRIEPTWVTVIE